MQNIIYKSQSILPWDTQSAFKMTSYNVSKEDHMIFCYLKTYVHGNDLVLCCYNFLENPSGNDNIEFYLNISEEKNSILKVTFGYDGIKEAIHNGTEYTNLLKYSTFKANDEQGFYWCGEITLSKSLINKLWNTTLAEKSILTFNMVQKFPNGDFSVLNGNSLEKNYNAESNMNVFVILNY